MNYREIHRPSPHFSTAPAHERLGVCFHHSVMDFESTLAHMRNPASEVSYHLLIAPDGTRARLVADEHGAWHAGVSTFQGRTRCNDFLLGVSFAGDTYAAPLTAHQIASALEWLAPRWHRHGWTPACMTDHRRIAPARKNDLAPAEWTRLITAIVARFPTVI
jgi:N-acetyl-anhydromuramoyl-L-alanine amidase